jgi:transcriptional regulator with XRE-family HTH domain
MLPEGAKRRSELALFLRFLRHRIDPDVRVLGPYTRLPSRVGKRVTQEELSEAIGVSREWCAVLESGGKTRASTGLVKRLADALMVTPEDRARLFHLAVPGLEGAQLRADSIAVIEAFSRLRSLSKRLWAATSIEDILTTASEQIADWFDGALLVGSARRCESGLWEPRYLDDNQGRKTAAKVLRETIERVVLTTGSKNDLLNYYPRLAHAGDVGTPDLYPLALQRTILELCSRHRVAGYAARYARVRSRTGFTGGLLIVHQFGHSISAANLAVLGAFAELTSFALS